jgi:hypothetical protein
MNGSDFGLAGARHDQLPAAVAAGFVASGGIFAAVGAVLLD